MNIDYNKSLEERMDQILHNDFLKLDQVEKDEHLDTEFKPIEIKNNTYTSPYIVYPQNTSSYLNS